MTKKHVLLANGETYAYLEAGDGEKPLLLVHGNFSSGVYYKPLLERLPKGYRAYAPDLRGYGDSTYHNRISSLKEFAEDLVLFMQALKLEKAAVVGWSLGGGVVMELAAHHPDLVAKLVLINSTTHKGYPVFKKDENGQMLIGQVYESPETMADDPIQVKPLLDALEAGNFAFVKYIFDLTIYTVNKPTDADTVLYINESLKQRNLPDADFALASQNMSAEPGFYGMGDGTIGKITCPVLHIWGNRDITVPELMIEANINALKANSTYVRFENCGHSPLVDKPLELAKAIENFLT